MTATQDILQFAGASHELPLAVRKDAARLLADTLATGAAGAASLEARMLRSALDRWCGSGGAARLLSGNNGRLPASQAAFFNGFAIHCLEWDAVHDTAVVHALSVVTAALLAASDERGGSDSDEFLTALAVGVDIASGLGIAAMGPMRFFRPATAGIIGAALAVARLESLAPEQFADVLGMAYSFTGGTMQAHVEASVALPLQIARAAQGAVQAVGLVRAGFGGPHDVIQGPFGYSELIEPLALEDYTVTLGETWRISEISVKPFPSGRASHGALGALQALRAEGSVSADNWARIELFAPPLVNRLVGRVYRKGAPASYNRLCLAFLAPLMLRDGHIDPRLDETEEAAAANVIVSLVGSPDHNALSPQRLVIDLRDSTRIERVIKASPGSPGAPMSPEQAAAKYSLCRELAKACDPVIFTDPLRYATDPQ